MADQDPGPITRIEGELIYGVRDFPSGSQSAAIRKLNGYRRHRNGTVTPPN